MCDLTYTCLLNNLDVQELVGMSASTYNAKLDNNNKIFVAAVMMYFTSYGDNVIVLSVVDADSSRSLRSSESIEVQGVPTITVMYEVQFSSNPYDISSDYGTVDYLANYMQSNFPYWLNYCGSFYSYSYPNSFSANAVTSSSLTSISNVYLVTDDDDNISSSSSSKGTNNTVIIAAAVGGGGGGVLLIVGVLAYCFCRRRNEAVLVPVEESGVELNISKTTQVYPYSVPYSHSVPVYQGVEMQPEEALKNI